jgi:hypothetical protein
MVKSQPISIPLLKIGIFHTNGKVVNSLPSSNAGMARRRRSSAAGQSRPQSEPIRVQMKGFRPLPRLWVAIRGRHLPWVRRSLGLAVSPMARSARGGWIRTQAQGLSPHWPLWKPLICVGLTDPPSHPSMLLRSTAQSVLCLGVYHSYSDDGYDRT